MHAKLALLALLGLLATARGVTVEFEYYKDHDCQNKQLDALLLGRKNGCVNLLHPGKSFHIGGPSTEKQVPQGCTIRGYADKKCGGSLNVEIIGPSSESKCYITGVFMGEVAEVNSVQMACKGS